MQAHPLQNGAGVSGDETPDIAVLDIAGHCKAVRTPARNVSERAGDEVVTVGNVLQINFWKTASYVFRQRREIQTR